MGTEVLSRQLRSHRGNNSRSSTWPSKAETQPSRNAYLPAGHPSKQWKTGWPAKCFTTGNSTEKYTVGKHSLQGAVPVATTGRTFSLQSRDFNLATKKTHALPVCFPYAPYAPCVCSNNHVTTAWMPSTVEATSKCAPKLLVPISTMKVTPCRFFQASTLLVSPPQLYGLAFAGTSITRGNS